MDMWWPELMRWNCSAAQKNPVRTALPGKTVQVKWNISTGVWSALLLEKQPHVILGQEMLKSRDGVEKDEGELTGGKRLIFFIKMHKPKN